MSKHIWYRLEYKRAVDKFCIILLWMACTVLALSIGSLVFEPDGLFYNLLTGLAICGCFLLVVCVVIINTLTEVDKHEWELTKKQEGGKTQ